MSVVLKVATNQARDLARSRWLLLYALFFLAVTEGLLRFSGGDDRAVLSLSSIVLYLVPLVSVVFGTVYLYGAREFTELLLAQPIDRKRLFFGLYLGLAVPLVIALAAGLCAPFAARGLGGSNRVTLLATLLLPGIALTMIFSAIAFCIALATDDKLKGLALAIGVWMLCDIVYDGLVMAILAAFADYPLERPMLAMTLANPVDLARVSVLLTLDVSALMGYTGAVFQQFLGGALGVVVAGGALLCWIAGPTAIGLRAFRRKDF